MLLQHKLAGGNIGVIAISIWMLAVIVMLVQVYGHLLFIDTIYKGLSPLELQLRVVIQHAFEASL